MTIDTIKDWLSDNPAVVQYLSILGVIVLSYLAFILTRKLVLRPLRAIIKRSSTQLDDILLQEGVFRRLLYIVPALILYNFSYLVPQAETFFQRLFTAVIALILLLSLGAFLSSVNEIYKSTALARRLDIKSYIQVTKLLVYIFGTIIIVSILSGRSPWLMLSGIGAMTAVVLLIFRDTILSFVASIQISSSDLVRVGDWIEVPAFGADGDVIDIALHTVQVQNWDKTITVIPTHKLLDSSFKNWRGMSQSGGRRIKRAVYIDVSTIRLCDEELLERFEKFQLLTGYISEKRDEISKYNQEHQVDTSQLINGRRLTNVGTFRSYIEAYLRSHPLIHQDMTLLVRQLQPGPSGLPIEIYAFTDDTRWAAYEAIQADIFDHILAVVPQFDLRVFQEPTGKDFENLSYLKS
ncbi:MAG: mechanosensitive ion channel family protein [Fidelibacterota bacterium]|nr:MAG: mechanosensitive ion channel family protein [Candidatus Neomarinimicrobiota bacterium]